MTAERLKLAIDCVVDARNTTGESPLWSAPEQALYWVDIPEGRFWAGTMDERADKQAIATLCRLDVDHRCTAMNGGLKVSNGPAWSLDGRTLYFTSLRENFSAADLAKTPQAGGVFMCQPGVGGAPGACYQG